MITGYLFFCLVWDATRWSSPFIASASTRRSVTTKCSHWHSDSWWVIIYGDNLVCAFVCTYGRCPVRTLCYTDFHQTKEDEHIKQPSLKGEKSLWWIISWPWLPVDHQQRVNRLRSNFCMGPCFASRHPRGGAAREHNLDLRFSKVIIEYRLWVLVILSRIDFLLDLWAS